MAIIGHATVRSAPGIAKVYVDTWRSAYAGLLPDRVLLGMSYERQANEWAWVIRNRSDSQSVMVAAEVGHGVVGMAEPRPRPQPATCRPPAPSPRAGGAIGEIYTLYILPEFQERGIGRQLLAASFSGAGRARHRPRLCLDDPRQPGALLLRAHGRHAHRRAQAEALGQRGRPGRLRLVRPQGRRLQAWAPSPPASPRLRAALSPHLKIANVPLRRGGLAPRPAGPKAGGGSAGTTTAACGRAGRAQGPAPTKAGKWRLTFDISTRSEHERIFPWLMPDAVAGALSLALSGPSKLVVRLSLPRLPAAEPARRSASAPFMRSNAVAISGTAKEFVRDAASGSKVRTYFCPRVRLDDLLEGPTSSRR
jgi:GNAT superfamily N-acetyltransferase